MLSKVKREESRKNGRCPHFHFFLIGLMIFVFSSCVVKERASVPGRTVSTKISPPKEVVDLQSAFIQVAESVAPAVVNIAAIRVEKRTFSFQFRGPFGEDPFEEFFRHFFPPELQEREYRSVGSGVIIDKRGYVLTNYHVVEGAKEIQVTLGTGKERKTYKGEVMGSDAHTDLAVIKIKEKKEFPHASLGNSDKIRVGEWAIAIGSPFGLEHTLTVGVISAKRQNVSIENRNYEDLIQTDASINPGNSGGPLVNIYGEVIGINVAIFTPSGGFVGVGFAIPINKAKEIVGDLIEHGEVIRGWLGVRIQEITDELAKSFNLKDKKGILISEVLPSSPAEKAGLKRGDVLVEFNHKPMDEPAQLQREVAKTAPNKTVSIKIIRAGKVEILSVKIGRLPEEKVVSQIEAGEKYAALTLQNYEEGVMVISVEAGSAAENAGIREGDIIKEVNHHKVENVGEFKERVKQTKGTILFLIKRGEATIYVAMPASALR